MMTEQLVRLGSRESSLALAQTHQVAEALRQQWPALQVEIHTFKTQGDIILDTALSKAGDKGLFVKELEVALLERQIDVAVHSMKDMPGAFPDGLALVSFGEREDARDVLVSKNSVPFEALPAGAVVGTSSLRREAQLRRLRPDLTYQVIRGNLQTRYRKLEEGPYEAIVLAAAGIRRLGWQDRITQAFDAWEQSIPAVAQGILGLEFRVEDGRIRNLIQPLLRPAVEVARLAERAVLTTLAGGCQLPLGAYCRPCEYGYEMKGVVLSVDGTEAVYAYTTFEAPDAVAAGQRLAQDLLQQGGKAILDVIRPA
ncbi:hydroxymethylbilane synthase [Vampirovibrio chlorellavorus]|uniref:hydroxymethylbilane synthase n=1 Tax=Vampirovibrio chlorellavorus TaxID=758823 RepID=UPI0026EC514B|nr:hydroxymethylbilane synthase [Vampirovibrio chlorellavorus]